MAVDKFESPYGLIFNFNQQTSNFEREFCAYVIGKTGDCNVGSEMVELYEKDHPKGTEYWALSDRCNAEPDDRGCYRPVSIYRDPMDAGPYESLIIFFGTRPEDDEVELILARAKRFCEEKPHLQGYSGDYSKYSLFLKGARLITNKVERIIKTEKTFDVS